MSGSILKVTFMDGEVKEYSVSANPTVVNHLAKSMSETGFLSTWDDKSSLCIPADQIREFTMQLKGDDE